MSYILDKRNQTYYVTNVHDSKIYYCGANLGEVVLDTVADDRVKILIIDSSVHRKETR